MGIATNNIAKLCALKLLLSLALGNQISKIQVFGDSLLVINWVTGKFIIHNLQLSQILQEVIKLTDSFLHTEFKHIYRERNVVVDKLANAGGKVQNGYWHISEYFGSERIDTYPIF